MADIADAVFVQDGWGDVLLEQPRQGDGARGGVFEIEQIDPFMTMAPKVRPDKIALIPAGIHVDGTARIQTVDSSTNPRFYGVIEKFDELTGVPVVLNTSFNLQEPIVQSPENAISCYLRTQMDVLVLDDFYITDRDPTPR